MTWEQFWFGDPWMAKAYRDKHNLERRQRNEEMWLNGLYQLSAVATAINNSFNKHKAKYVEKPFDIFPKTEAEREAEKREERQKLINWLNRLQANKKDMTGS